jgi:AcrR family transcriptional regulator
MQPAASTSSPVASPMRASGPRRPYDRAALVDIAADLFHRQGYDATSMDDLAAAARVSKAALYYHIDGKEDLLRDTVERGARALNSVLAGNGTKPQQVHQRLVHVVRTELAAVAVLIRARGNSPAQRRAKAAVEQFAADLAARFTTRDALDPVLAAEAMLGLAHALVERSALRACDPADLIEHLGLITTEWQEGNDATARRRSHRKTAAAGG